MALTDEEKEKLILKSKNSIKPSFVRFVNHTTRAVDCIWINYEGRRVRYKTLHPNEFFDVNTFVSHPWIFRDTRNHDKMCVTLAQNQPSPLSNSKITHPYGNDVFMPPDQIENGVLYRGRRIIYITLPIYSLKERCFQLLRETLQYVDVDKLEIPKSLKSDYYYWLKANQYQ